jgi:DNA-binding NtrC family response regulator
MRSALALERSCYGWQLKREIKLAGNQSEIIGQSQAAIQILTKAEEVAFTDAAVLLLGENLDKARSKASEEPSTTGQVTS